MLGTGNSIVDVHVADTADYFRRVFEDEFGS
jgi:hypothetical protein